MGTGYASVSYRIRCFVLVIEGHNCQLYQLVGSWGLLFRQSVEPISTSLNYDDPSKLLCSVQKNVDKPEHIFYTLLQGLFSTGKHTMKPRITTVRQALYS